MKKFFAVLLVLLCLLCVVGCSSESANEISTTVTKASVVNPELINAEVSAFIGFGTESRKDRTPFSDGEKASAEYIKNRLANDFGYEVKTQQFSVEIQETFTSSASTLYSQNLIAKYNDGKEKTVIVGAHYDNSYSDVMAIGFAGTKNEGVSNNATGVSALLSLAKVFNDVKPTLDYTVTFVFFGAGETGGLGSMEYVTNEIVDLSSVALYVNLDDLDSEKLYFYSDEVETNQQKLFAMFSEPYETKFSTLPSTMPLVLGKTAENLDYYHYGLQSDHVSFFEKGVPCINVFGGEYDGFKYYAPESDTLNGYLAKENSGKSTSDAVNMIYATLTAPEFLQIAETFDDKFDYSFFNGGKIIYIVFLGIIILCAVVLLLVVKRLEKKYPRNPKVTKKVKVAVFGMEYENKSDSDVFLDIRPIDPFANNNEPFRKDDEQKK